MALWQKGIDDPDIKIRRYHCPECGEYSLHIKYESFAECENGCFLTDSSVIDKLIESKDYKGVFQEDELKYNFI
ncbi:MAG TPA: hypothetical protein GXX46_11160 [Peptococcaceae bacterium]|nr:hypothetical protein [Peptococcaceae bacterium]